MKLTSAAEADLDIVSWSSSATLLSSLLSTQHLAVECFFKMYKYTHDVMFKASGISLQTKKGQEGFKGPYQCFTLQLHNGYENCYLESTAI